MAASALKSEKDCMNKLELKNDHRKFANSQPYRNQILQQIHQGLDHILFWKLLQVLSYIRYSTDLSYHSKYLWYSLCKKKTVWFYGFKKVQEESKGSCF